MSEEKKCLQCGIKLDTMKTECLNCKLVDDLICKIENINSEINTFAEYHKIELITVIKNISRFRASELKKQKYLQILTQILGEEQ